MPLLLVGDSESNQNLYYKTHFLAGDPFLYFEDGERRLLVVGDMERGRAQKESIASEVHTFDEFGFRDLIRETKNRHQAFSAVISRVIDGSGKDVRVEGRFPVQYADALRAGGTNITVDPEVFNLDRRRKSSDEIEAIAAAQRATEVAVAGAVDLISRSEDRDGVLHLEGKPLTSERIRTEIEVSLITAGMDPNGPIVAGGPGAADPHWLGSGPLRAGESIIMDVFPRGKSTRYHADMTRTVVRGNPGDTLRAMYAATVAALDAAIAEIRPGANGRDVHAAAIAQLEAAGFQGETGPRMSHSTGHGVGLDIHESPGLGTMDVELIEGDVITVEPGLYDRSIGGIRVEDMVVVTTAGCRNLTNFPRQFEV